MKKKVIVSLTLLILLTIGIAYAILSYEFSSGARSGRLVKLTKKGVVIKTYEGTLDLGSGDDLTWDFTIRDKRLGETLLAYTGRLVKLEYQELLHPLFYDTKYNVRSFELESTPLEDKKDFCRLANYLRRDASVVQRLRQILENEDKPLLEKIRSCQN